MKLMVMGEVRFLYRMAVDVPSGPSAMATDDAAYALAKETVKTTVLGLPAAVLQIAHHVVSIESAPSPLRIVPALDAAIDAGRDTVKKDAP